MNQELITGLTGTLEDQQTEHNNAVSEIQALKDELANVENNDNDIENLQTKTDNTRTQMRHYTGQNSDAIAENTDQIEGIHDNISDLIYLILRNQLRIDELE